ncbi:carbonic anhydrase [Vampirovibrio sp.]|uniref:carbonic anhydrase n=1 Tax=Vampirovibrio sp. TaxID=2717857 RepID=UPI00359409DC
MEQVILGVKKFQKEIYPEKQSLFQALAKKQDPKILFITCSDSRIDPSLITQTDPGSMFLIQNAGNIIPPHGSPYGGTGASIEYAVTVLNVEHIIICGHTCCGAMAALLDARLVEDIPIIRQWISYADSTRAIVQAAPASLSKEERMSLCIKQNVQVQMSHLKTIPSVAARLSAGQLSLHGWVYHIESGSIDVYSTGDKEFVPFEQAYPEPALVH